MANPIPIKPPPMMPTAAGPELPPIIPITAPKPEIKPQEIQPPPNADVQVAEAMTQIANKAAPAIESVFKGGVAIEITDTALHNARPGLQSVVEKYSASGGTRLTRREQPTNANEAEILAIKADLVKQYQEQTGKKWDPAQELSDEYQTFLFEDPALRAKADKPLTLEDKAVNELMRRKVATIKAQKSAAPASVPEPSIPPASQLETTTVFTAVNQPKEPNINLAAYKESAEVLQAELDKIDYSNPHVQQYLTTGEITRLGADGKPLPQSVVNQQELLSYSERERQDVLANHLANKARQLTTPDQQAQTDTVADRLVNSLKGDSVHLKISLGNLRDVANHLIYIESLPPNHPDRANIVPLNLYAGTSLYEIQQHAIGFAPEVLADAGLPQVLRGVTGVDNLLPIAQPMPDNVFLRHLRSMINRRVNIAPPKLDQDTLTWLKREHPDDDKLHHLSLMTPPSHEPPKSFADLKPLPPPSIDEQVKLYQEAQRVLAEAKAANKPATAPATDNLDSRTGTPPQPEPQPTPPLAENQPKVYSAKEIQELSQTLDQVSEVALAQFEKKHDLLGIFQIALMKTKVGPEVALGLLQNLDRIKGIPTELAPTIGELTAYLEQQISAQPTSPLLEAAQRSHLLTADQIRDLNDPARRGEAMDEIIQTVKEHRGDTTALQSFFKDENIFGADFKYGLDTIFAKAGSNIRNTKDIKKFIAEWQKLEQGAMEYYKNEAIHGTQKGIEKSISGIFALFLALSMVQGLTGDQPQGGHQ